MDNNILNILMMLNLSCLIYTTVWKTLSWRYFVTVILKQNNLSLDTSYSNIYCNSEELLFSQLFKTSLIHNGILQIRNMN